MEINTNVIFKDESLKTEFDRLIEAAQPYIDMAKRIAEHSDVIEHEFTEEEIERIDAHVENLNESFEGEISESSWFYLRKEKEFVTWVNGDTGFNFTTFTYDEIS